MIATEGEFDAAGRSLSAVFSGREERIERFGINNVVEGFILGRLEIEGIDSFTLGDSCDNVETY